jgi:hypothetical protein
MEAVRRRCGIAVIAVALVLVAASCGSDAHVAVPATASATAAGSSTPQAAASSAPAGTANGSTSSTAMPGSGSSTTTAAAATIDPALGADVATAVADLASRLGVDPATITTVSAALVSWSNSALGCPQPGMSYAQVPVDGAEIVLSSAGARYSYHMGGTTSPFLCEPAPGHSTSVPPLTTPPGLTTATTDGG